MKYCVDFQIDNVNSTLLQIIDADEAVMIVLLNMYLGELWGTKELNISEILISYKCQSVLGPSVRETYERHACTMCFYYCKKRLPAVHITDILWRKS